ncbi:hypothetical protein V8E54_003492 [Elaphomyces granulatus]
MASSSTPHTNNLKNVFDPWNSSSTGHQRADHPTYTQTTGWRQTRTEKLARQFGGSDGLGGRNTNNNRGMALSGEWRWLSAGETKRKELGCDDIRKYMGGPRKKRKIEETEMVGNCCDGESKNNKRLLSRRPSPSSSPSLLPIRPGPDGDKEMKKDDEKDKNKPSNVNSEGIFSGLSIYINGSTAPLISDHRLKQLLVDNGANISIALGRRTVTHVILGKPNSNSTFNSSNSSRSRNDGDNTMKHRGGGAGGGLAGGKLQKEIRRIGGKGVIYVGVEW